MRRGQAPPPLSPLLTAARTPSIGHNEVIGVCRVGPDAADPHGREHWAEMLANPRKPVEHWHQLVEVSGEATRGHSPCHSGAHAVIHAEHPSLWAEESDCLGRNPSSRCVTKSTLLNLSVSQFTLLGNGLLIVTKVRTDVKIR